MSHPEKQAEIRGENIKHEVGFRLFDFSYFDHFRNFILGIGSEQTMGEKG